jgi:hypothetical protein
MNKPALRCPNPSIFVLGLLIMSVVGAAAAEEGPRVTPQAREAFQAVAPPLAMRCQSCDLAHQKCFTTCFADMGKGKMGACLTACNNTAATCTCDGAVTLRSEDLVEWGLVSITKAGWDDCHLPVNCQPNYPSCASWSSLSSCGDLFCDFSSHCGEFCDERGFCWPQGGPAYFAPYERFRVCFDQFGNSCTEWQNQATATCGECDL